VFFWVITQRVVIQCSLTMGRISCPETSVSSYHYSLRNSPERSSSPLCGGSLTSRKVYAVLIGCPQSKLDFEGLDIVHYVNEFIFTEKLFVCIIQMTVPTTR